MRTAVSIARAGGAVGRVGVPQDSTIPNAQPTFYDNITLADGPAPVRAYMEELLPDVLDGRIEPGRVFDRVTDLDGVPEGYRAMNDRGAIKVMTRLGADRSTMVDSKLAWLFLTQVLLGCQSTSVQGPRVERYLATERTIDVGVGPGLCVAIDVNDPVGVWWWEPGGSGCGSRSTGPGVFHPEAASITRSAKSGVYEVSFRLGTHSTSRPFIDVRLLAESGTMRAAGSKQGVRLVPRSDLEIPEMPPGRAPANMPQQPTSGAMPSPVSENSADGAARG